MGFWSIFKDDNIYDEKNIVGFLSFAIMVIFAVVDLIAAWIGKELIINDIIFNSFVWVTLGSFGIAEIGYISENVFNKRTN